MHWRKPLIERQRLSRFLSVIGPMEARLILSGSVDALTRWVPDWWLMRANRLGLRSWTWIESSRSFSLPSGTSGCSDPTVWDTFMRLQNGANWEHRSSIRG